MKTSGISYTSSVGIEALGHLRKQSLDSGIVDMSLDDINVEIKAARADRKL
jgi:hypothetical protein